MKFVCDKCKTRYSIAEDRVRGKILKIRCKNCANVITVREGMDADADAAPAESADSRRSRPTTAAPLASSAPAAATPPPVPTLQAEWYVSIDGVQSGPLSLSEAQKWVSSKAFEAELHCWSEGFDDWLPVDKVSHFRNLRKPRPAAPPARPARAKTVPPPLPPQPLFSSTMAQLEKDASSSGSQPAIPAARPAARAVTPAPAATRTTPAPGIPRVNGSGSVPALPAFKPDEPDARTEIGAPAFSAAAFDVGGSTDSGRAATASDPFFGNGGPAPASAPAPLPAPAPAKSVKQMLESDEDDGLSIGEVSRVVKLADLAPKPRAATQSNPVLPTARASTVGNNTGAVPRLNATGAVPRIGLATASNRAYTASQPKLSPSELGMNVDPSLAGPAPDESLVARSFASRHRRGMLALIALAGLLVAAVIGAVIYVNGKQNDEITQGGLGGTRVIDTSRPEDLVKRQLPTEQGSGSATVAQKPKWVGTRPNPNPNTQVPTQTPDEEPKGGSLRASEIEDMAAKQGEGTKRCYMRAQKGALGFEIADLKKINVTLTVGKDGAVNDVQLSSHGADALGTCLIARIKAWKFRESSGGTFRISLAFANE